MHGWIFRIRRDAYGINPPIVGKFEVHDYEIAMELCHFPVLSHWCAFHHHGLVDEPSQRVFCLVDLERDKALKTEMVLRGTSFQFVRSTSERFFGFEEYWLNSKKIRITNLERTLLDGITRPELCGGFPVVFEAFGRVIDKIEIDKIVQYALLMNEACCRRLGLVLERWGVEESQLLPEKRGRKISLQRLDPSEEVRGETNKKWLLVENTLCPLMRRAER